jgi:hypothetical protein
MDISLKYNLAGGTKFFGNPERKNTQFYHASPLTYSVIMFKRYKTKLKI